MWFNITAKDVPSYSKGNWKFWSAVWTFVGITKDFIVPCAAAADAVCSVLMGHQQIKPWHLPHTISILELLVPKSISLKLGFPELQMHSLTHSNLSSLPNPKYNNTGSFYLNFDSIACYETNILNQPLEWRRILDIPLPSRLSTADFKRIHFIGTGSSFWAAKIAEFLRREYVHMDAIAVQSYDFVLEIFCFYKWYCCRLFTPRYQDF